MNVNDKVKELVLLFITILGIMVTGYLLIVLGYLIPKRMISNNVYNSAYILMSQGLYPSGFLGGWFLDNYTDADCISVTYNESSSNPFYNALNAFELGGESDSYAGGIEGLQSTVYGDTVKRLDHNYLWHGYRIWLRPLLMKYDITNIRCLCYWITIFLIVGLCILLVLRKNDVFAFIPFLIAFTFFNFQMEALSLLFFNDFAVTLLGCIIVAYISDKKKLGKYYKEVFAGIGAVLAFTSMLILPVLTIGFTIVVWLMLAGRCLSWREKTVGVIKYSLCWFVGYAVTMLTKVAISKIAFSNDRGFQQIFNYTGNGSKFTVEERFESVFNTFERMMRYEIKRDILICSILLLLVGIAIRGRKKMKKIYEYIPYFIVALYPCAWCFICSGHSGHGWTYFNYSISLFALFSILLNLSGFEKKISIG